MRGFIAEAPAEWRYDLALSSLRKGEEPTVFNLSFSLGASVKHWGLEYRFDSPVEVSVSASRVGDQIVADISVASESSVPCSRCLERALLVINGNLRYLFSLRPLEREKTQPENKKYFFGRRRRGDNRQKF